MSRPTAGRPDVRRVRPEDVPDLVASVQGLFDEDAGRHDSTMDLGWPEREGVEYYSGIVTDPACLLLLAHGDERVLGHLVGKLVEPDGLRTVRLAVLESMRVAPEMRGRGIGSLLVGEFFGWARENRAVEASVTAYSANEAAVRFYGRHGFLPSSTTLRAVV